MDFWDITKLLARRWMIMVPLLMASAALAVLAMAEVKPDYDATAHVQLVPPVMGPSTPGQATADQRNPWIGLGLQTIGNAAIVTVTDLSVVAELKAQGYSDSYTVVMTEGSPLINFEVIGNSPEQATQTADQLVTDYDRSIASLQAAYGVPSSDLITTHRLDVGPNVKASTGKIKRAAVAVAGAGLLVTVATTVGVDAWIRRRQRRRAEAALIAAEADASAPRQPAVAAIADDDGAPATFAMDITQPVGQRLNGPWTAGEEADVESALAMPSDATIVLPTPGGKPWLGRSQPHGVKAVKDRT